MKPLSIKAKIFISLIVTTGVAVLIFGVSQHWDPREPTRYLCYFAMAMLASRLKVSLPGITGTMSANFLFDLIGIAQLGLGKTLVMGCLAALLQCFWNSKAPPRPIQVLFNVSNIANAIAISYFIYRGVPPVSKLYHLIPLLAAACAFFVANTVPVATVVSLTEGKKLRKTWKECYFWSFPYYLIGAVFTGLLSALSQFVGWESSALVLPIIYWFYRSYRLYLGRLEDEKRYAEETAALHLRTGRPV